MILSSESVVETEKGRLDWIKGEILERTARIDPDLEPAISSINDAKAELAASFMSAIITKYGAEDPGWNSKKAFDSAEAFIVEFEKRLKGI